MDYQHSTKTKRQKQVGRSRHLRKGTQRQGQISQRSRQENHEQACPQTRRTQKGLAQILKDGRLSRVKT